MNFINNYIPIQEINNIEENNMNQHQDENLECKFSLNTYPLIFHHNYDSIKHLEELNKVVLPSSVLNRINRYADNINGNIVFQLKGNSELYVYISVESFQDDISDAYIPMNLIDRLLLNDGDLVEFELLDISKGTKITIQPHTSELLEMEDFKSFLEIEMNHKYDILTNGDTISLEYNNKTIYFDIKLTLPNDIISIKNTDLEVEFEQPLDYDDYVKKKELEKIEKEKQELEEKQKKQELEKKRLEEEKIKKEKGYIPFGGKGHRLGD